VVDHQVEQQPDATRAGLGGEFHEVPEAAEPRVDPVIVADVIPAVTLR
jgi:hypothetical protein